MKDIGENLFYSEKEKLAFYVAGYTDQSRDVNKIVKMLQEGVDTFVAAVPVPRETVKTQFITISRRYAQMRVFYAPVESCPGGAFSISDKNGWTMDNWLRD